MIIYYLAWSIKKIKLVFCSSYILLLISVSYWSFLTLFTRLFIIFRAYTSGRSYNYLSIFYNCYFLLVVYLYIASLFFIICLYKSSFLFNFSFFFMYCFSHDFGFVSIAYNSVCTLTTLSYIWGWYYIIIFALAYRIFSRVYNYLVEYSRLSFPSDLDMLRYLLKLGIEKWYNYNCYNIWSTNFL